jgi:preprotein translocase subunit SecB
MNDETQASLSMERIYIKDLSYEAPKTPQVFLEQKAPAINIQIDIQHQAIAGSEGYFEVILILNVDAKNEKNEVVFLIELKHAGVFILNGIPENEIEQVLEIACPNILLPFAREAVSDFVAKGGFPQFLINPINFEALFQQRHGQATKAEETDSKFVQH